MEEVSVEARKKLNEVARHEKLLKILADINFDIQICKLEGWDCLEYIELLKKEIDEIYFKIKEKRSDK